MTRLRAALTVQRLLVLVLVVAAATTAYAVQRDRSTTTVTAWFTSASGLYVGDDVKVLGVRVGEITAIEPQGERVRVEMTVHDQPIPEGADAAIVSPSLVSGRFVQLAPAYTTGPTMPDGAEIPLERTAVPVAFDDVKQQITDLAQALGPGDEGGTGALARALRTIDDNLRDGNSEDLRAAVDGLGEAALALSDNRSDLFSTLSNLNTFTRNLAVNDAAVRGFTDELAAVSAVLADNRRRLTAAVSSIGDALGTTEVFFTENRARIRRSAADLRVLSRTLASRGDELAGVLHLAPTTLADLYNVIEDQAITGRASLTNLDSAAQLVCGAILGTGGTAQQCFDALQPFLDAIGLAPGLSEGAGGGVGGALPEVPGAPAAPGGVLGGLGDLGGLGGPGGVGELADLDGLGGLLRSGLLLGGAR